MAWEIEVTDQFWSWWADLTTDQQAAVSVRVELLGDRGPSLGRPAVERIVSSRHHNMKELRSSRRRRPPSAFMFDPRRQVILLLGGDKSGQWNEWYERVVPFADELYGIYLDELREEGLI